MNTEIERLLSRVQINERAPGSILRDFETLLDFVGVDGVKAGGKYGFLPMACLKDLNERLRLMRKYPGSCLGRMRLGHLNL